MREMKTVKILFVTYMTIIFSLGCSASYAEEDRSPIFLTGKVGNSVGPVNCSGICSAHTSGTIGIGYSWDAIESLDSSKHLNTWDSITLEYKRDRFSFNGNQLNLEAKGIDYTMGYILPDASRYILVLGLGVEWQTVSGGSMSDRTAPIRYGKFSLLYKVNSNLYLSFGYSPSFINSGNPDYISNSVNVGFRWYPSVSK